MPLGATEPLTIFLLLQAFAGGSVALTGVEAIANGVPAFKPPEAKNAANTMIAMAVLLGDDLHRRSRSSPTPTRSCRRSTTAAARRSSPSSPGPPSATSPLFYLFQIATALILFLAANTSFNAFPRLAAILAEDGYMPRQFASGATASPTRWGIVLLAGDRLRPARRCSTATPTP